MAEAEETRFLTAEEVEQRIRALSRADCVRIERLGQIYSWGLSWTPADLLQEAMLAAMEVRRWRSDLTATVFLVGAMRSIAHSKRKSSKVVPLDRALRSDRESSEQQLLASIGDQDLAQQLEEEEKATQLLTSLLDLFADDPQVLTVIRSRVAGESAGSVKATLGLGQRDYETVCRRLVRGYQKRIKVELI